MGEDETIEVEIVYRGSDDGWKFEDFHRCADHKGETVTLLKIDDGDCIGGYTTKSWHHRDDNYDDYEKCLIQDDKAFIFNLTSSLI